MVGKKNKSKSKHKNDDQYGQKAKNNDELETTTLDINNESQISNVESDFNDVEQKPQKRKLASNESADFISDIESKHKKSKKKKPPLPSDPAEKKNKKSIRQMKKEKHAERQAEAEAVAKDQLKSQCLNYLSQWKHDRQNWKFMKAKQVWLFKNKFSSYLVPDANWPILLEYFESAKGNIRNMLLADANKIIKQMDDWTDLQSNEENSTETQDLQNAPVTKPDDSVYNRARSLLQCLEE